MYLVATEGGSSAFRIQRYILNFDSSLAKPKICRSLQVSLEESGQSNNTSVDSF